MPVRIAILGQSPCHLCQGINCCRQNGHDYAVLLEESEYARFGPFAADVVVKHSGRRFIEKALPYIAGRCQFLANDGQCLIYDDRPANCRRFQCVEHFHKRGSTPGEHGVFLQRNPDVLKLLESL